MGEATPAPAHVGGNDSMPARTPGLVDAAFLDLKLSFETPLGRLQRASALVGAAPRASVGVGSWCPGAESDVTACCCATCALLPPDVLPHPQADEYAKLRRAKYDVTTFSVRSVAFMETFIVHELGLYKHTCLCLYLCDAQILGMSHEDITRLIQRIAAIDHAKMCRTCVSAFELTDKFRVRRLQIYIHFPFNVATTNSFIISPLVRRPSATSAKPQTSSSTLARFVVRNRSHLTRPCTTTSRPSSSARCSRASSAARSSPGTPRTSRVRLVVDTALLLN